MKKLFNSLVVASSLSLLLLVSCSKNNEQIEPEDASAADSTVKETDLGSIENMVEVNWLVQSEPVDAYHLHYGERPSRLSEHKRIDTMSLEKTDHPEHGPIYSYNLPYRRGAKALYVAIQAENNSLLSEKSSPLKIEIK